MSQIAVEQLIGRLVTDGAFRTLAKWDLRLACHEGGLTLTDEELRLVGETSPDIFTSLGEMLAEGIRRGGGSGVPLRGLADAATPDSLADAEPAHATGRSKQ